MRLKVEPSNDPKSIPINPLPVIVNMIEIITVDIPLIKCTRETLFKDLFLSSGAIEISVTESINLVIVAARKAVIVKLVSRKLEIIHVPIPITGIVKSLTKSTSLKLIFFWIMK
jgi:hypothetical protein